MMKMIYVDNQNTTDPRFNLALEEYLLRHKRIDEALTRTSACVTAPIDEPVTSQENSGTAFGERSAPRTV